MDLKNVLNPEQYRAATTTEGPLLVLAGAGSGKTRVLVHRIAYILSQRLCRPWQILAVTFTNKAAGEMRERLEKVLGDEAKEAWIGTFHAMCGRLLRRHAEVLGYGSNFTIYDTDDSRRVIKRIMAHLGIDPKTSGISVQGIAGEIDRAKNKGLMPKAFADAGSAFSTPVVKLAKKIYPRYQDELRAANAMDFGDMLLLTKEMLQHHPEIKKKYNERFEYVLVDEFQDTNAVQYNLLRLLVGEHDNLAVVGDDDQSIYRWRGAEVRNILDFPKKFAGCATVKLERNYRSTGNILDAANAMIARNKVRHDKRLYTEEASGEAVGVAMLPHSDDEAQLIAQIIAQRIRRGQSADDFAILYRQNAQSRLFELAFKRARVPFVLIGSTAFFDRKEVKDVLSYLRLVANPSSTEDFERIINVPPRKIGAKTIDKLRAAGATHGVTGAAVLELDDAVLTAEGIKGKTLASIRYLADQFERWRTMAETDTATNVATAVISDLRYADHLRHADPTSADDRIANIGELVTSIADHEATVVSDPEGGLGIAGARTPLQAFLDEASLTSASDRRSESGSVSMLTLHAAKGLEFPVVFLVGMEEYTFPGRRAIESDDPASMEEERRLCYVGVTRAMKELFLTAVRYRRIYGSEEVRSPSRFLGDIPNEVVGNIDVPTDMMIAAASTYVRSSNETIEFDDEYVPQTRTRAPPPPAPMYSDGGFAAGTRVFHNTFGDGVVEMIDGSGPRAHLTIRFDTVGRKRVVARYVRAADGSVSNQS